jgi:transposase InsO family protein
VAQPALGGGRHRGHDREGKLYLAAILDLFSRSVVGWALSAANDRHLALNTLEQALRRRCPEAGLLHHTDQESPYASEDYPTNAPTTENTSWEIFAAH